MNWGFLFTGILLFLLGIVGGVIMERNEKPRHVIALAMGFDEDTQLWNRIRVDKDGFAICHKE